MPKPSFVNSISEKLAKTVRKQNEFWILRKQIAQLEKRLISVENKAARTSEKAEMSKSAQQMVEALFSHLSPKDVVGHSLTRVGRSFDGGYLMIADGATEKIAYSLGINRDVSWDLEMAQKGFEIYQYDHTIDKLPHHHDRFHFFRKRIVASPQAGGKMTCLRDEFERNGHQAINNIVLKMDIEGDEWEVFADLRQKELQKFSQILVEFHNLHKVYKLFWFRTALDALSKLTRTHQSVHIHGNNNTALRVVGGYAIPPVLEVTFLRRDMYEFAPCTRTFPSPIDQPNNPSLAEHQLGNFQFPSTSVF